MKVSQKMKIMLKSLLSLQMGEVATDKAVLIFDGEELVAGMEVFVMGEGDEPLAAEDGEYTTEDGKTIKVVEGRVAEIVDPEAEVADEPIAEVAQDEVNEEVQPVEEEPVDEPQDENIASLEDRVNAITEGLDKMLNSIAALEDRIAELEDKLAKVEEPAAEPIDEEPKAEENDKKNILSYLRKD